MTWADVKATGSGRLRFRVSIEGFPYEAVTHLDMERTTADGRQRYGGLSMRGTQITQRADLVNATLESGSVTFKIGDDRSRPFWTEAFAKAPTATTWLDSNITDAAGGVMPVKSTSAFASDGYLYLDQEVIRYEIDSLTGFVMSERGCWDTLAAYHYVTTGGDLRYPEITDWPTIIEGRRVRIFVYGAGDDPQGDGEQIWLGILRGEPKMQGPVWSFMCDSIAAILDSEVASDLGEAVQPRGINLGPEGFCLFCRIGTGSYVLEPDDAKTIAVKLSGFYPTQAAFVDAINAEIEAGMLANSWGDNVLRCVDDSETGGSYHFEVTTDGADPRGISVISSHVADNAPIEPVFHDHCQYRDAPDGPPGPSGMTVNMPVGAGAYWIWAADDSGGRGRVPRGYYSEAAADAAKRTVYVDGIVGLSGSTTSVRVAWDTGDLDYYIEASDAADRWIEIRQMGPRTDVAPRYYTPNNLPTLTFGRTFGQYNLGTYGLMADLSASAAEFVNTGAQPMIRLSDWESSDTTGDTTWFDTYDTGPAYVVGRIYVSTDPVALKDLVCPDLQLARSFLSFSESGKLTIRPLRLPAPTEVGSATITRLFTNGGLPQYERGSKGIYNTLIIRDGYDSREDDYTRSTLIERDVTSYGRNSIARAAKIELKSKAGTYVTYDNAVEIASTVLGIFGAPYAYVTCEVPLTAFSGTILGSPVSITTSLLPNSSGTRGVSLLMGLVTARELDLYGGRIALTLLCTTRRVGGYAPDALIASRSNVLGNTWALTLTSSYFPTGTTAEDYLEAGDRVMAYRFDSTTAGTINGSIVSVAANVATVLFDSTFTPGSDDWSLSTAQSSTATASENQRLYAHVASSSAVIDWNPDPDATAFTFNPG